MVIPSAGPVVILPFALSGLTQSKLRPAVVLAVAERGDWVLCQVTSKPCGDSHAAGLHGADFAAGGLRLVSYARPAKLFTARKISPRRWRVNCAPLRSRRSSRR